MKKHLLTLACAAMLPCFAGFAMDGEGTAEDPYQIVTIDDFNDLSIYEDGDYFILMNDIDFAGVNYVPPFATSLHVINFDGNNHVLSNLTSVNENSSVFGYVAGTIKNLGVENVNFKSGTWGPTGGIGGYCGYGGKDCTIENCYVTGSLNGYFAGGIAGGIGKGDKLTVKNCYTIADCTASNGYAGGIVGCVDWNASADISYSFAAGSINGAVCAGGIVGGTNQYLNDGTPVENITLDNVAAYCAEVKSKSAAGALYSYSEAQFNMDVEENDTYYVDYLAVNSVEVKDGIEEEELNKIVMAWDAYASQLVDGYPTLKWVLGETDGISEITVSEEEGAAEYFNLQGVKVANPENGLYIVRRGNTISKVIR